MARGEGAEQCAASLLSVKAINTEIKTTMVSAKRYIHTHVLNYI